MKLEDRKLELTVRFGDKEKTIVFGASPLTLCWILERNAKKFSTASDLESEPSSTKIVKACEAFVDAVDEVAGPLRWIETLTDWKRNEEDKKQAMVVVMDFELARERRREGDNAVGEVERLLGEGADDQPE